MNSQSSQPSRRTKTRELIDHMLTERDAMLALLWRVSGRDDAQPDAPDADLLREFTSLLVDYIAAGHFGLYQRITDGTERRKRVLNLGERNYGRIDETTQIAVAFNDRYSERTGAHLDPRLPDDLVRLAEAIGERISLEDEIIEAIQDDGGAAVA